MLGGASGPTACHADRQAEPCVGPDARRPHWPDAAKAHLGPQKENLDNGAAVGGLQRESVRNSLQRESTSLQRESTCSSLQRESIAVCDSGASGDESDAWERWDFPWSRDVRKALTQ